MINLIDFIIHIDDHLSELIQAYGTWVYAILFLIIFLETGLVVTPILPGDSLIFAAGAFAGTGVLNVFLLFVILCLAAIIGDSVNYFIGNFFGEKVFLKTKLIKKEYLEKTKHFYDKHGPKTIILARFIPIIRTFAPFVAGVGKMSYSIFLFYNITGGIAWVAICLFAGYFFGGIPLVKDNFSIAILLIIFVSLSPVIYHYIKRRLNKRRLKKQNKN
jgi:membrane-associated protein